MHSALTTIQKCQSLFFADLIIRTLAYAWTTGARFANCISDLQICPFYKKALQALRQILGCSSFSTPLRVAVNSILQAKDVAYVIPLFDFDDLSEVVSVLIPPLPTSPAHLLLLAAACDCFHAARHIHFSEDRALHKLINSRVLILASHLGNKFWSNIHKGLPRSPNVRPQRSSRRKRSRVCHLF